MLNQFLLNKVEIPEATVLIYNKHLHFRAADDSARTCFAISSRSSRTNPRKCYSRTREQEETQFHGVKDMILKIQAQTRSGWGKEDVEGVLRECLPALACTLHKRVLKKMGDEGLEKAVHRVYSRLPGNPDGTCVEIGGSEVEEAQPQGPSKGKRKRSTSPGNAQPNTPRKKVKKPYTSGQMSPPPTTTLRQRSIREYLAPQHSPGTGAAVIELTAKMAKLCI